MPDASSLAGVDNPFVCPVPNCGRGFTRSQNLDLHLRTHKDAAEHIVPTQLEAPLEPGVTRHYYCPVEGCRCDTRSAALRRAPPRC